MAREAKARKARRLRYKEDDTEVLVPQIDPGCYHTFLSHVWGTGRASRAR